MKTLQTEYYGEKTHAILDTADAPQNQMYRNLYETGKFLTIYETDFAFNFLCSLSGVLKMKNCKTKFST